MNEFDNLSLTPEQLAEIEKYQEEVNLQQQIAQPPTESPAAATAAPEAPKPEPTPQPTQQQQQPATEAPGQAVETSPFRNEDGSINYDKIDKYGGEQDIAEVAGIADWAVSGLNKTFETVGLGWRVPYVPKFESDSAQFAREVSEGIIPSLIIGAGLQGLGAKVAGSGAIASKAPKVSKFLNDPAVRWIGNRSAMIGGDVISQGISKLPEKDDNLPGVAKKMFPRQTAWIPDEIATLDKDSPDLKRLKNMYFSVGLGGFTDSVEALSGFLKAQKGLFKATKFIPESEQSTKFFKNIDMADEPLTFDDYVEELMNGNAASRAQSLDEIGAYRFSKNSNLDEPTFGVHDMWGYHELGVRGTDNLGIVGAATDNAQIMLNKGSVYGRVGNGMSDAALEFVLDDTTGSKMFETIKGLGEQIKRSDNYSYEYAPGKFLTNKEIQESGAALVNKVYGKSIGEVQRTLTDFRSYDVGTGMTYLTPEADFAVVQSIGKYMDLYANLDDAKASALLAESLGGQISDISFSTRYMDQTDAVNRAEEMILDRVEYLYAQDGMTRYLAGRNLNMLNFWKRITASKNQKQAMDYANNLLKNVDEADDNTFAAIAEIQKSAKGLRQRLVELKAQDPEFMKPLRLAYELTDGDVDTIYKMNKYLENTGGFFNKAVVDFQTQTPSLTKQAIDGIVYNNVLSALGTPVRATESILNATTTPLAAMIGAASNLDMQGIKQGAYMYARMGEVLRSSFKYSRQVFRRSGLTEELIPTAETGLNAANAKQLEFMDSVSDAYATRGELGPRYVTEQLKTMNDLANHPWLSIIPRSLQTMDGFNTSIMAQWRSGFEAFNQVTDHGKLPMNLKTFSDVSDTNYSKYFNEDGLISDSAVKTASGQINYNLDTSSTKAVSGLIRSFPAMKPFAMFTRTPLNEMSFMMQYEPVGALARSLSKYKLPFDQTSGSMVDELLTSKGMNVKNMSMEDKKSAYDFERNLAYGRKAMGTIAVSSVIGLMMSGIDITGDGLADREKQRVRRDLGWKPRSINGVSYDNLGPLSDWVAMTVNIVDNFDSMSNEDTAGYLRMSAHILSSVITEKTMLPAIEPLLAMLTEGNPAELQRFVGSYLSSATVPGSGQIAEVGRLLDPLVQDMQSTMFDQMMSRDPLGRQLLPNQVDYIDGGEIGTPSNIFARFRNVYTPWKTSGKLSEPKQYLMDVEYDARPVLSSTDGVEYTRTERQAISQKMGEQGIYRDRIMEILKAYPADEFRQDFKEFQTVNTSQRKTKDVKNIGYVHSLLDSALQEAISMAEASIDPQMQEAIRRRKLEKGMMENYAGRNEPDNAKEFLKRTRNTLGY